MKYITLFETAEAYNAAILDLPNVSLIEETMSVSYHPWVESETKLVCKYNVTSTSEPTALRTNYEQNIFKSMEVDGVMLDELVTKYTFDTTGEHIVKYELYDETKLGNQAPVFNNDNLIECVIPDSVTSMGQYAFQSCGGLTNVTIGNSITSIGNGAFNGCRGLTSITIPDSVTSIGDYAFLNCRSLTSCTIGSGVTSIGSWAFGGCRGLTSIVIPSGVTSIGNSAFWGCSSFTSIDIPDSVTSIGTSVFRECSGLTSCTIGSGVTSIGEYPFSSCSSLTSITSNATTAPTITSTTFQNVKTGGTLTVPQGSTGYDVWMGTGNYYLGKYNWTKVEQ